MPVRYVITTLKPGVRPEDYERWLRETPLYVIGPATGPSSRSVSASCCSGR